jgi:hypothetical protein
VFEAVGLPVGKQVDAMADEERLVAIISLWRPSYANLRWKKFRLERLPGEEKLMAWRDDLQTERRLRGELKKLGIEEVEVRTTTVTA